MTTPCSRNDSPLMAGRDLSSRFDGLLTNGLLAEGELRPILDQAEATGVFPETLLIEKGVPRHEILRCLSERFHLPFVEFNERIVLPENLTARLDLEALKRRLWFPLRVSDRQADVVMGDPGDGDLVEQIKAALQVRQINLSVALPGDITRFIEHHQDVNPHYPVSAGRTVLARLRNVMARMRTLLSFHRTSLAKGRTGLAMMRTGFSFSAVALVLLQVFGIGYALIPDAVLLVVGLWLAAEGLLWYLPIRRVAREMPACKPTESTFGSSYPELYVSDGKTAFVRHPCVAGADKLRMGWNRLSPVMKRRFLAIDRTDHAEERTALASYRSAMARARTGLAFTRTGIALIGFGIALLRQFPLSGWVICYAAFILAGTIMTLEGFHWYIPGRRAGNEGLNLIRLKHQKHSIWDFMFSGWHDQITAGELPNTLFVKASHSPGIWGTTGLALERTLIAERRNVKARLRTILARSRTGMAFIRTGVKIFSVGLGLLVYFGLGDKTWIVCDAGLMVIGLIFIIDGFLWHLPAERIKASFPYCSWDMEIQFPDYAKPTLFWKKVVFSHYDL